MDARRHIFLTGATGQIGRYLLRDFLVQGHCVTALVRPSALKSSIERVEEALSFAQLPRRFAANVHVLEGQLPEYHPDAIDSRRIQDCDLVVHSAASLHFHKDASGDPFRTNAEGTRSLVELALRLGIRRWIQVSTAYVCGDTQNIVHEDHPSLSDARNFYESSKRAAEKIVRQQTQLDWTIVRPGIVVGDSITGYTSAYQGVYRCFQSIAMLVQRLSEDADGVRRLPLRFHLTGDELTNLIPVDWVSEAISRISLHPNSAKKHFHLTPRNPVSVKTLVDSVHDFFGISGIEFVGPTELGQKKTGLKKRNAFERVFDRETSRLGPYFNDDPHFARCHLDELLPDLWEKDIDSLFLRRLLEYAETDGWGIRKGYQQFQQNNFNCRNFFETYFPKAARNSQLARIHDLTALIGFEIEGRGGGFWLCKLVEGDVAWVAPADSVPTEIDFLYRTNCKTLEEITNGRIATRDAFFERRIEIVGNIERALLLALLFEDLLKELPYRDGTRTESSSEKACA